jgi:hypothetical protein
LMHTQSWCTLPVWMHTPGVDAHSE